MHDLALEAERLVVVAERLQAVRTRRHDLLHAGALAGPRRWRSRVPGTGTRCPCAWRRRRCSVPCTARRTSCPARAGSRRAIAATSGSRVRCRPRIRATAGTRAARIERLELRGRHELLPRSSDVWPQRFPRRSRLLYTGAEVLGRLAVAHQAAPRADDHRRVLDADRDRRPRTRHTSCTATARRGRTRRRASRRALPSSSAASFCRISVFGIEQLAGRDTRGSSPGSVRTRRM